MANVIKHKRGSGSDPSASDLVVGEVAIRTDVGKLFTKMDNGSVAEIAGGGSDIAINTLSSSSGTGGGSATFNGSAYRFTLSAPPSVSAQQLLVSINGVIQKPVAGTGQPSEGFSVDGTDIILGDAPATGADFFILTFKSLGVSEPADNSVTSAKIVDGAIVNADINASAAIARTKLANVDLVDDTSPQLGGDLATNGNDILIADNDKLKIGTGNDLVAYHDGTSNIITNVNGNLFIQSAAATDGLKILNNGAVELFHAGSKKFQTTSSGVQVLGTNLNMLSTYIDFSGSISTPSTAAAIYRPADNTLAFSTANTERMTINPSGNVGIGATSPGSLLTLNHATNPAIQFQDSGTKVMGINAEGSFANIASHEGKALRFATNSGSGFTSAMVIDTSQQVGIGTESPTVRLHCDAGTTVGNAAAFFENDDNTAYSSSAEGHFNTPLIIRSTTTTSQDDQSVGIQFSLSLSGQTGSIQEIGAVRTGNGEGALVFRTRNASEGRRERMRINSSGKTKMTQVHSGQTEPILHLDRPSAASNAAVDMIHFDSGNQGRGKVLSSSSDSGSPSFAARSDYRIKENIRNYTGGWDNIKAVPVKLFDVKTDGSKDQKGWIAHELQAVLPDLVQGTKDAVVTQAMVDNEESDEKELGNPIYQTVSMGLFMPDVISALQTAIAKIETLETKVAALEAG